MENRITAEFRSEILKEMCTPLTAEGVETLQVNIGKYCNQACLHCHVDAGPQRLKELMSLETMTAVIKVLEENDIESVDITGGAPELHPYIDYFIRETGLLKRKIILRSNLTALLEKEHLLPLLKKNRVEVVASLPCYTEKNVDLQRGSGAYQASISALQKLNNEGYGIDGNELMLNLVYNPAGPVLPGSQGPLESDYKRELGDRYGITFNKLFVMTNMPLGRFKEKLIKNNRYDYYTSLLINSFNKKTVANLMCRKILSVSWDGQIFDCDFNQALGLTVNHGISSKLYDFDLKKLKTREIRVGNHCFGCTAGRGSSCGGELGGMES